MFGSVVATAAEAGIVGVGAAVVAAVLVEVVDLGVFTGDVAAGEVATGGHEFRGVTGGAGEEPALATHVDDDTC